MIQQVTIWIPTVQLIIDLITAYFLIGFTPWLAWCISETWCDYGRNSSHLKAKDFLRLIAAWFLWPVSIKVTKKNLNTKRFNRPWNYYR